MNLSSFGTGGDGRRSPQRLTMKILGYIGVAGGLVAILLAFPSGNGGLVFVGLVAILCGVISVAVHNLRERLDSLGLP